MASSSDKLSPLGPRDWLTQLGPKFWNQPKHGQIDVSLWVGRLSVERMVLVVGGPGRQLTKRDDVRYFMVGCLRDAGFILDADTKLVNGERHVSVKATGEWTTDLARKFDACAGKEWSGEN